MSDAYLKDVQDLVVAARPGPWDAVLGDDGAPAGFGPFPWVDVWVDDELVPNIEFCRRARALIPALLGEIARLKDRNAELERAAGAEVLGGGRYGH